MGIQSREAALIDELTGLSNRRHLNRRLPEELRRAESAKRSMSLFILDVDYFKDINDTHGHRAGDDALVKIADLLRSSIREADTVFRYAGDEFVIILPDTDSQTALSVARKIAERASSRALEILGKPLNVTVSVGVATYPEDGEDPATLFDIADRALYVRKRRGRNGVCGKSDVVDEIEALKPAFCPELVGREKDLSRLKEQLTFSFDKKGSVVFLSGESGVGKTRLLNEFSESARRRGVSLLSGRCFGEPTSFPYQSFKDAISKYFGSGDDKTREALGDLPDVYRDELLDLIPELAGMDIRKGPRVDLPSNNGKLRLFDAVRLFLLRISEERPLILILDDFHLADEPSTQLLHYLARSLKESRVLICVAYREEELEPMKEGRKPLAETVHSMRGEGLFSSMTLSRLSQNETSKMIELIVNSDKFPQSFSARLFQETEGNPLFVEEVLKSLIETGKVRTVSDLDKVELDKIGIPAAIRDVVQRRLDMLDPETNQILSFASVIGHRFDFGVLLSMGELNEGHLLELIDRALRSQLIVEEGRDAFRFSHRMIDETIYDGIAKRKRMMLHRVAGESLEKVHAGKLDEFVTDLSFHFLQAEDWAKVFKYCRLAGNRAKAVYANDNALLGYQTALDAFSRLGKDEQEPLAGSKVLLYQDIGGILDLLGRYEEAVANYRKMRDLARSAGDRKTEAEAVNNIGTIYWKTGSYGEAMSHYEDALAICKEMVDEGGIARGLHNIGAVHWVKGSQQDALKCFEEALRIREKLADKSGIAKALNSIGAVYQSTGCLDEALEYFERSLAISRELGEKRGIAFGLHNIGIVHQGKSSYDKALRCLEDALAVTKEIGDKSGIASNLQIIGVVHQSRGSNAKALRYYEESLEIMREIGDKSGIAFSLANIGAVHQTEGSYEKALSYFEDALAVGKEIGEKGLVAHSIQNIGEIHRARGFYDQAAKYSEDAMSIMKRIDDRGGIVRAFLLDGELKAALGFFDEALDLHERARRLAEEIGDAELSSIALTELGADMVDSGDPARSLTSLTEALKLASEIGNLEVEADALSRLGETYIELKELKKADETIQRLADLAKKTGSKMLLFHACMLRARTLPPAEAISYAKKALRFAEDLGSPEFLWRAHQAIGRILRGSDSSQAAAHYRQAREAVESIASRLADPKVRDTYLSKPEHRELFAECGEIRI
jgi:diguanylate cyclase (GGDEF)-like protein